MGAQLRVYRRRIRSVQSTKKITRAMELIASSRLPRAQAAAHSAEPYVSAITGVVAVVGRQATVDHPLTRGREQVRRVAVLIVSSDRGLAGPYSANVLKAAEVLQARLRAEGKEPVAYLTGRKALAYYRFRNREPAMVATGFSERPSYADAKRVADQVITDFVAGSADGGVDEVYLVYTRFVSALTQRPEVVRILPADPPEVAPTDATGPQALYEFEPNAVEVLDALLPRYVESVVYQAFLTAAASELASRRRAMQAATDSAEELIRSYTRLANAARQAEITQEIMEIVGGAEALSSIGSE